MLKFQYFENNLAIQGVHLHWPTKHFKYYLMSFIIKHLKIICVIQGVRLHWPVGDACHCADLCHRILDFGDEQIFHRIKNHLDSNVSNPNTSQQKCKSGRYICAIFSKVVLICRLHSHMNCEHCAVWTVCVLSRLCYFMPRFFRN